MLEIEMFARLECDASVGTSWPKFIICDVVTVTSAVQTLDRQTRGGVVQTPARQQSLSALHGTRIVCPCGKLNIAVSNAYVFGGRSKVIFVMLERSQPTSAPPTRPARTSA